MTQPYWKEFTTLSIDVASIFQHVQYGHEQAQTPFLGSVKTFCGVYIIAMSGNVHFKLARGCELYKIFKYTRADKF